MNTAVNCSTISLNPTAEASGEMIVVFPIYEKANKDSFCMAGLLTECSLTHTCLPSENQEFWGLKIYFSVHPQIWASSEGTDIGKKEKKGSFLYICRTVYNREDMSLELSPGRREKGS